MDILSGKAAVEAFQHDFSEAAELDTASMSPHEFKDSVRLNAHQSAFAEHFAHRAPQAWQDLCFLEQEAVLWLDRRFEALTGTGSPTTSVDAARHDKLVQDGIRAWAMKYGINTAWIHTVALLTLRGMAFAAPFDYPKPTTLLYETFPTLMVDGEMVELGKATLKQTLSSTAVVCADLGVQEWDTLKESKAQFRRRLTTEFTKELGGQLDQVETPLLAEDLEVSWHWIDMTIERYAGHMSIRALHKAYALERPAVTKAVEKVRQILEFRKLPESWGATKPNPW